MTCAVYMLTNDRRTVLYVGVTSELEQRIPKHKLGRPPSAFTNRHNVHTLVWSETTPDIAAAIARQKLKGWRRSKKVALVEAMNPEWCDLATEWTM